MDNKFASDFRKRAMRIARVDPETRRIPRGEPKRAILALLDEEQRNGRLMDITDRDRFYREVWRKAIRVDSPDGGNGEPKAKSNGLNSTEKTPIFVRYHDLTKRHDALPGDSVLMDLWGCAGGTLSSIRSRLKYLGYSFEQDQSGGVGK